MQTRFHGGCLAAITIGTDRDIDRTILPLYKRHLGETVIFRVYRNNKIVSRSELSAGRDVGTPYHFQSDPYHIPANETDVNRKWKGDIFEGWRYHWKFGSDSPHSSYVETGDVVRVFAAQHVLPQRHQQSFANGVSHCILTPMREWGEKKRDDSIYGISGDARRKTRSMYSKFLEVIDDFDFRYKSGLPDEAFTELVASILKNMSRSHRITIDLPMQGGLILDVGGEDPKKRWHFTNTRLNHGEFINEVLTTSEVTELSAEQMSEKLAELIANKVYHETRKKNGLVSSINTLHGQFRLISPYFQAVNEFEQSTRFDECKIDALKEPLLSDFVCASVHANLPGFQPDVDLPPCIEKMVRRRVVDDQFADFTEAEGSLADVEAFANEKCACIDKIKSYATFHECRLYETELFPSKINVIRPTSELHGPGVYLIDNLDWTNADQRFRASCKFLKDPFQNNGVYPRVDLVNLRSYNVRFTILAGAWADGNKPAIDFRFPGNPDEKTGMYQKTERGAAFYAVWFGACASVRKTKYTWMNGEREYFENLAFYLPPETRVRYIDDDDKTAIIESPASRAPHLAHLFAYVNSYERTMIIDQLMEMDLSKVFWLDKDDISYEKHDFKILPGMKLKEITEKSFGNAPTPSYVSNNTPDVAVPTTRATHRAGGAIAHVGGGGRGKTYDAATDDGLCKKLYICPGHDLRENMVLKHGFMSKTLASALGTSFDKIQFIKKFSGTLLVDEISMYSMEEIKALIDRFAFHKIVFIGDPGYQLPLIKDPKKKTGQTEVTLDRLKDLNIPIHQFNKSYRFKNCPAQSALVDKLREMIDEKFTGEEMCQFLLRNFDAQQIITPEKFIQMYDIHDRCLCSLNKYRDAYDEKLKQKVFMQDGVRMRRYRADGQNGCPYPNGRIIIAESKPAVGCIEKYTDSVHGVQGQEGGRIFIDTRHMWDVTHWHTAISRATQKCDVFLVHSSAANQDRKRTHFYSIRSPHTEDTYNGRTQLPESELRLQGHIAAAKSQGKKSCSSKKIIESGDAYIVTLETRDCTHDEAISLERHYIETDLNCVNKVIPGRTAEERRENPNIEIKKPGKRKRPALMSFDEMRELRE